MNFKIPYGESDFKKVITDKYLFLDKSKYIETLENDVSYQFFLRPRKFGKSLFLSMLSNYYDIDNKDDFDRLFGKLYIGKNPTPKRNSYLVLKLDFSRISTNTDKSGLIRNFDIVVIESVKEFLIRYKKLLNDEQIKYEFADAMEAMSYISLRMIGVEQKILLLIDEYDSFSNDLMTFNQDLYYDVISSQGYIRSFYKMLKSMTGTIIDRIFVTGVAPILLDDLTSVFNIAKNLTLEMNYNEMLGFTINELENVIDQLEIKSFHKQMLIDDMGKYYSGYLFNQDSNIRVFNPNMVLYFLDNIIKYNKYPKNMIDLNIKTDYKKLENLAVNLKDYKAIETILIDEQIECDIIERFNLEYMDEKNENFISLLFYMGMLTIKEIFLDHMILKIPNISMKEIYWDYFKLKLSENDNLNIDKIE